MEQQDDKHSREEVWTQISQLRNESTETKTALAGLTAEVRGLATAISQYMHQHNRPHNWVATGALIISILAVGAQWVTQTNKPQDTRLSSLELKETAASAQRIIDTKENARISARNEIMWELIVDVKDRMHTVEMDVAGLKTGQGFIKNQADDIDHGGSRIWNRAPKE